MQLEHLIAAAKAAAKNSYSPYSQFVVASAFCNDQGEIFTGINVENASYGLSICAERNAIFSAATQGNRTIDTLVIYTPTETATPPCGACRQVINEFSSDARIVSVCDSDDRIDTTIDQLLPGSFSF